MENEQLATSQMAPVADDNFNMNVGWAKAASSSSSSGVARLPATRSRVQYSSPAEETFAQWVASTFGSCARNVDDAGRLSWEATVPVAAYSLDPSLPNVPAGFAITKLRAVAKTGLEHFVVATSSSGKPLYGAYVVNSQRELCLQQLFEFSQTAFDAGVFLPVPTVGGHFQGAYGLDYARHRFCGSVANLPRLMRWPAAAPSSVCPSVSLSRVPSVRHDDILVGPVNALEYPAAVSNSVPPTDHDSFMISPQLPPLPHRGILLHPANRAANAVSSQPLVASSSTDRGSSKDAAPERAPEKQQLQRVPSIRANEGVSPPRASPDEHPPQRVGPSSFSGNEGVSPFRTPDEHPQQRVGPYSSCANEGVSPPRAPDEHLPQRVGWSSSCSGNEGVLSSLRAALDGHPPQRVGPSSSGNAGVSPLIRAPDEHPPQRAVGRSSSCSGKAGVSPQRTPDEHPPLRVGRSSSNKGVSPLRASPDEHPLQRVPGPSSSFGNENHMLSPILRTLDEHPPQRTVGPSSCSGNEQECHVSPLRTPHEHPPQRVGRSSSNKGVSPLRASPHELPPQRAVGPSSSFGNAARVSSALLRTPDEHLPQQVGTSSNKGVSPLRRSPDEHDPRQQLLEAVKAASSAASQATTKKLLDNCNAVVSGGAGTSRRSWVEPQGKRLPQAVVAKAGKRNLPQRCHPCFLCAACKKHWGISGLPEEHFDNPRKEVFRTPEEDVPAILSSEKTAARKRKWAQCRHGPKSKTSEFRGVNLYKRTWKWEAHIWYHCEQIYLGASITKNHAAEVYDRAALFLFGPDAEINFRPEKYQEEYEFMHRLTYGQMVIYLRRESRENGEEVRYPGVAKVKAKVFCASYRPRKEKESLEHIGYFKTEDDAVRSILKEALRRKNYVMAGRILDVHHVRTVKPAPGLIKQTRQSRAACIVASIKFTGSEPSKRTSKRAQRVAANPNAATQAAEIPTQEVAIARPKRKYVKKTVAKSTSSPAGKNTVATVPAAKEKPRSPEETGAAAPARTKRKYIRKTTTTQEKSAPKRSTQGRPLIPAGEVIAQSAPVAAEAPPSQEARAARKRKFTTVNKSEPSPARNKSTVRVTTELRQPEVIIASEAAIMAEEAPPAENIGTSTQVLDPNATPQPMTVAAPTAPVLPPAQIIPASSSGHPFMTTQEAPVVYDFLATGSWSGPQISGSDGSTSLNAYSADMEGESSTTGTPESPDSAGSTNSSCISYQFTGRPVNSNLTELNSFQTPPRAMILLQGPTEEEIQRHFQEACNWLAMQRRNQRQGGTGGGTIINPRLPGPSNILISAESPGVIRPVARRLSLTHQAAGHVRDAAASGAQIPGNMFSLEGGHGQLIVDLFGPPRTV